MDTSPPKARCPRTLGNLSEPARDVRDGRHLLELRYLCIGRPQSTENGATALRRSLAVDRLAGLGYRDSFVNGKT
jgi:hypothetical protein